MQDKTPEEIFKEHVIETLYNHYKKNGGYTRTASSFIEKITGEKWERDDEIDKLKEEITKLKKLKE